MPPFHLAWFLGPGSGVQGWNQADRPCGYPWNDPRVFQDMARLLERGCFDLLLTEDSAMVPNNYGGSMDIYLERALFAPKFDPVALVPYLAQATEHIGLVPTLSTIYYPPFLLSRLLATLGHFTGGRVGWNIVTSTSDLGARNYGLEGLPAHDLRYDMADEFVELCTRLWESWEPGAVVADERTGVFTDPSRVNAIDFEGKWYRSAGPLNLPLSSHGRPLLAQAGNSPRGRDFAARHAELIMASPMPPAGMRAFRDDIHRRAAGFGRSPGGCKVLFIISPVLFDREEDAADYSRHAASRASRATVESALARLGAITGIDFSRYGLDDPLPDDVVTNGNQSTLASMRESAATVRDIGLRWAHLKDDPCPMVGTPEQVADRMGELMDEVGGDGYLMAGDFRPRRLAHIVDGLVPALQRRGLMRTGYGSRDLRSNVFEF